jgi:predicted AAA+ superfamily ATPase
MSVLGASYLIPRLPAWRPNICKQVVKARKLHFFATGLTCYLIGILAPEQLRLHPLREFPIGWSLKEVSDETTPLPSR